MKFTMRMPFYVVPGVREVEGPVSFYTATVQDNHGREVWGSKSRSVRSQATANMAAMRKAREWAKTVRYHAGVA